MTVYRKDPNSRTDFTVDWAGWLADGEQLATSDWTVPTGITTDDETHDATTATIWLTGGTLGDVYQVVNRIETDQGRIDERTMRIHIIDR
jgi:hypothetical protein